ncbi:MAG: TIGR01777 family oxidoreductase [Gemmatimonadaceae bacterium]
MIAITGARGFLGSALVASLEARGRKVIRIGRGPGSDVRWDPLHGPLDHAALAGAEVVIHLAGAPIAQRWTAARKRTIRDSRVEGTRQLAEACARMPRRPALFLSASAIGIYGSRGGEVLDESSATGEDFLAEVGRAWEEAAAPAREAGMRVVAVRTGLVLNPEGGALGKMLLPFKAGLGGTLGSGTQWMSWISREDWVRAMQFIIASPGLSGPVNLTAPEPVTNAVFTETLGRLLHRPTLMPLPAFGLKLIYGEMAQGTILASQRVLPRALTAAGFIFLHPTLATALRVELRL